MCISFPAQFNQKNCIFSPDLFRIFLKKFGTVSPFFGNGMTSKAPITLINSSYMNEKKAFFCNIYICLFYYETNKKLCNIFFILKQRIMVKDGVICTFIGHILNKLLALEEKCPIFKLVPSSTILPYML